MSLTNSGALLYMYIYWQCQYIFSCLCFLETMKDIEKQLASTRAKFPPSQLLETASEISADENEIPSTSKQSLIKVL